MRNIFIVLVALLLFTFILNAFDNSKFQMNEYSTICHSIYSEKVWIDTCNLPTKQNATTYESVEKLEFIATIICGIVLVYAGIRGKSRKK
jgi:hypothetical protein